MSKLLEQINSKKTTKRLGDLVFINQSSIMNGFPYNEIEYIDTSSVTRNNFDSPQILSIDEAPSRAKRLLKDGDTILSTVRPSLCHYGFIKTPKPNTVASTGFVVLTPKNINPFYLYSYLTQDSITDTLSSIAEATTTAFPAFRSEVLSEMEIEIPDLPTQKKIAEILSAYDAKIENNNKIIKNLEVTAQAIFKEWFVDFRFPGHEKKKMIDSEIGEIPEGWEVSSLGKVSDNHDSKRIPLSSMERNKRKGSIPYYGANGILDYIDKPIFSGEYLLFAEDGTVKTSKNLPVIYLVDGDFWVNNHAHIISGKGVSNYFLYLSLCKINIDQYITGGVQPKITQQNLNSIPILIPDKNLLSKFEKIITPMKNKIKIIGKENEKLKESRNQLLAKLI